MLFLMRLSVLHSCMICRLFRLHMADFEVRTETSRLYMAGVRAKSTKNIPPKRLFSKDMCHI